MEDSVWSSSWRPGGELQSILLAPEFIWWCCDFSLARLYFFTLVSVAGPLAENDAPGEQDGQSLSSEPIILIPEEEKQQRLYLRKKVASIETHSKGRFRTAQRAAIKQADDEEEDEPLITIPDTKEADTELPNPYKNKNREEIRRSRGYNAPTHRWSLMSGLKKRNRVADFGDSRKKPTKDEEFLKLVEGRPIKSRLVRRQYIEEMRERLRNNVLAGFLQDEIKVKEENAIAMNVAINKAQQEIENASKSMAEFLSEEQEKCDNLTKELNEVVKERKRREAMIENEKKKMSEVKLKIFKQSEQLEKMRKCREFVFQIAPKEWKEEYAVETEKRQHEVKEESNKVREALENFKSHCGGEDPGLEQVLEDLVEEFSNAGPPLLPFSDPKMVYALFKDLEMKSLKALHINAGMKEMVQKSKSICESFENYMKNEQGAIENRLKDIEESIKKEEKTLNQKRQLLQNMMEGPFKKMVAAEDVLKEYALVKDVYYEVIDQPKEGLSTLEMLQEIGELFTDLHRRLEHLPESTKKYFKKKVKLQLEKKMKEAEKAERRKMQVQNMVKGLQRAREKPWQRSGRSLLFKSKPLGDKKLSSVIQPVKALKPEQIKKDEVKEEPEDVLPLVWDYNHPGPGPYKRDTVSTPLPDHRNFYPDTQLVNTEESEELLSESDEEQDKKAAKSEQSSQKEEKKIKRKKRVKIVISDSDS